MVGGGTGITPLYQVAQYITEGEVETNNPNFPSVHLLFANKSKGDILLEKELRDLEKRNNNFKVTFSVDRVQSGEEWSGLVGFIDEEKIKKTVPTDL